MLLVCSCSEKVGPVIKPSQFVGDTIPNSLTGEVGDRQKGQNTFSGRDEGHCVLCHQVSGLTAEFQGNLGPDLTFVGDRLTEAQIRLRIVDYQLVRPGTVMPSYYRRHDLYSVGSEYVGETFLSAESVEDLVAYLSAQKE